MSGLTDLTAGSRRILDALWRNGPLSRAEIAERTGFTRPAISQMVQDLTDRGLLSEQPARKGLRGQPARPVVVQGDAGFTAGVNFSHTYLEIGLADLNGALLDSRQAGLTEPTAQNIGDVAATHLDAMIRTQGLSREKLLGVGMSMPGNFRADGGLTPHAYFPALRRADLDEVFRTGFGTAVILENDGRACAIGERVVGVGRQFRTFMLVHIGHGVGGGLIIDGRPYRGALGNAGMFGQFYPYDAPRPSGQDLLESLQRAGVACADFDALHAPPPEAEPLVAAWIQRAARQLSPVLAGVGRFFGPEAIIIAGRLPPRLLNSLAEAIDMSDAPDRRDDLPLPPVLSSSLGPSAGMIGAASLPIFRMLLPNA